MDAFARTGERSGTDPGARVGNDPSGVALAGNLPRAVAGTLTIAVAGTPRGARGGTNRDAGRDPAVRKVEDVAAQDGAALFAVAVETNFQGELAYQWQRLNLEEYKAAQPADEKDFWLDIPGETGVTLKGESLNEENFAQFQYRCRVTAGDLFVFSNAARTFWSPARAITRVRCWKP